MEKLKKTINEKPVSWKKSEILIHHKHGHVSYRTTIKRHLTTIILVAISFVVFTLLALHSANPQNKFDINQISSKIILIALVNSFCRLLIAYLISMIISIPLALFIVSTPKIQRICLPIADVMQSVPVLAFFPVVVTFFIAYGKFELAAIFILITIMIWNIVFAAIPGLKGIPDDIESAATVFNVKGIKKLWYITLPAIFPFLVIGSLDAWAQGWTTIIVAEVLHTYIPNGNPSQDLLGVGSLLVGSSVAGKTSIFIITFAVMILLISLINLFIWQRLLHLAQRFKFD